MGSPIIKSTKSDVRGIISPSSVSKNNPGLVELSIISTPYYTQSLKNKSESNI